VAMAKIAVLTAMRRRGTGWGPSPAMVSVDTGWL
jgi:hypothetical protein